MELTIRNKLGMPTTVPQIVTSQLQELICDSKKITGLHVDGELIGNTLFVFDLQQINGTDMRPWPFEVRYEQYQKLFAENPNTANIKPVKAYFGAEKRQKLKEILARRGEGVVFKKLDAPYSEGRPNSGGPAMKFPFRESSSCLCLGPSTGGKRSVRVGLLDKNGNVVEVGKVTVPPNQPIPTELDIMEISYLYKFEDGALFQPVLKCIRDDKLRSECTLTQVTRIKSKFAETEDE